MLIGNRAAENKNRKLTDISLPPTKCVHAASAFLKPVHGCLSITIRLVAQARLTALRCLLTRTHASKTTRVFAPTRDRPGTSAGSTACRLTSSEVAAINARYSIPRAKTMGMRDEIKFHGCNMQ